VTIDWTSEDKQHLRVISLVVGRRALPIFWRAYDQSVLKGRMKRYERAVLKRAFKLIFEYVEPRRLKLTADRGFPDDDRFELLDPLGSSSSCVSKGASRSRSITRGVGSIACVLSAMRGAVTSVA
jgi:hypothetical protein